MTSSSEAVSLPEPGSTGVLMRVRQLGCITAIGEPVALTVGRSTWWVARAVCEAVVHPVMF